jgi:hypothetical protein
MERFAINESRNPVSCWQVEDDQNLLKIMHNYQNTKPEKKTDKELIKYI